MAVTIRLSRYGRTKKPFYRIVVADKEMKRDGRFLESIGTLNPLTNPPTINLKDERVKHWINVGAWPSNTVASIINKKLPGYLSDIEAKRLEKVQSQRAKRKARAKAGIK